MSSWVGFTLYANRFDTDDVVFRIAKLVATGSIAGCAASASDAAGKLAVPFAACYRAACWCSSLCTSGPGGTFGRPGPPSGCTCSGTTQTLRSIWPGRSLPPVVLLGALMPFPASLLLTATYAVGILLLAAQGTRASRRPDTALAGAD